MGPTLRNLCRLAPIYEVMSHDSDIKLSHLDSRNRVPVISPAFKTVGCHPDQILINKLLLQIPMPQKISPSLCWKQEACGDHYIWHIPKASTCKSNQLFFYSLTHGVFQVDHPESCMFPPNSSVKQMRHSPYTTCGSHFWERRRPVSWGSDGHRVKPRGKTLTCRTLSHSSSPT